MRADARPQARGRTEQGSACPFGRRRIEGEPERRAAAFLALRAMVPPLISVSLLQMARPSPAPPNARVLEPSTCEKPAEQAVEPIRRNTDAVVGHGDSQASARLGRVADPDRDASSAGELDGVAEQVRQRLPNPAAVRADWRPTGRPTEAGWP
jgi:hypothetical protein